MNKELEQINYKNENDFSFDFEYSEIKGFKTAFNKLIENVKKYNVDIWEMLKNAGCPIDEKDFQNNFKYNKNNNWEDSTESYELTFKLEKNTELHYYFYDKENGSRINIIVEFENNFAYVSFSYSEKKEDIKYIEKIERNNIYIENQKGEKSLNETIEKLSFKDYIKDVFKYYYNDKENKIENNERYKLELINNNDFSRLNYFDKLNNIHFSFYFKGDKNNKRFHNKNIYNLLLVDFKNNDFDVLITLPNEIKIA